jgi:hypothetical protein
MGIIRKTVSVGTLGIVPFRSKRELLKRAEKDRKAAEAELQREHVARAEADRRIAEAERRMQKAELTALHEAKAAAKAKGRRKRGRKGRAARGRDMIEDMVAAARPMVEEQAKHAGRRAKKAAERSRKAAETAQREAAKAAAAAQRGAAKGGRRARKRLRDVEDAVTPLAQSAAARAVELKDEVVERSTAAAEQLKEKAESTRR